MQRFILMSFCACLQAVSSRDTLFAGELYESRAAPVDAVLNSLTSPGAVVSVHLLLTALSGTKCNLGGPCHGHLHVGPPDISTGNVDRHTMCGHESSVQFESHTLKAVVLAQCCTACIWNPCNFVI
jgi:hypothetical protein